MNVLVAKNTPDEFIKLLSLKGYNVLYGTESKSVQNGVRYHIDLQIVFINNRLCVCAPEFFEYYSALLSTSGIKIISGKKTLGYTYPEDCAYNIAVFGNYAVGNFCSCDNVLKNELEKSKKNLINVKQAYAKCSICIVGENAVITSDDGIYKTLLPYGIDVLKISSGSVHLFGYNYGFIGGASGVTGENLYFCGNIKNHPDYVKICDFAKKYGKNIVCSDNILTDVGTILFLA